MQSRKAILPLAILTLCACSSEPAESELLVGEPDLGQAESAIMGGYVDDASTHSIGIAHLGGQGFGACSGTLIAPNVVLTAQHCVARTSGDGSVLCGSTTFSPPYDPSELYITTRTSLTLNAADYHRAREIHVVGGPEFCGNDVAVIILDSVVLEDEAQFAIPRVDEQLVAGEEYYAIGHGNTSDGGGQGGPGGGSLPTRHRRDSLYTQCVGMECGVFNGVAESEWRGDTGVCSGDSGGGAYDLYGRVHGVASRGVYGCDAPVYGGVYLWGEWLKEMTVYAAGLHGIDPPAWATGFPTDPVYDQPVGDECTAVEDCASGACLDGYCTRMCNEAAYCPDGYECRADGWCELVPEEVEATNGNSDGLVVSNGCSVSAPTQDPTKPIPWAVPIFLGAGLFVARRRRRA